MKHSLFKLFFLVLTILVVVLINNHYEIFTVNVPMVYHVEDEQFRIMTYNINTPFEQEDLSDFEKGLIMEIEKHHPDILCMQEVYSSSFSKIQNSIDSLFSYTDSMEIKKEQNRYWLYSIKPIRNFKYYPCIAEIDTTGLDSVAKYEVKLYKRQLPIYSAEIEVTPNRWITVFSCHLRSSAYSTARRSMDEDASWLDGLPIYYQNFKIGQRLRNWEADNLRLYLEELEVNDTPVILAGDFNDWSGSYCLNTIRNSKYKDAWWEGGLGFGITYDEWHLKLRLDHILYSHHFKLENVYVVKTKFSDHRPLIADFSLLP